MQKEHSTPRQNLQYILLEIKFMQSQYIPEENFRMAVYQKNRNQRPSGIWKSDGGGELASLCSQNVSSYAAVLLPNYFQCLHTTGHLPG